MSKYTTDKSIEIRGRILQISALIESLIMKAIYYSSPEIYSKENESLLKIKNCMFSQKIDRLIKVLDLFHTDLKDRYTEMFDRMKEFKNFRNQIAHCAFYWSESNSDFEIWDISEDENKFQHYAPIKCSVNKVNEIANNVCTQTIPELVILLSEIESRLKTHHPTFYDLFESEAQPHLNSKS